MAFIGLPWPKNNTGILWVFAADFCLLKKSEIGDTIRPRGKMDNVLIKSFRFIKPKIIRINSKND